MLDLKVFFICSLGEKNAISSKFIIWCYLFQNQWFYPPNERELVAKQSDPWEDEGLYFAKYQLRRAWIHTDYYLSVLKTQAQEKRKFRIVSKIVFTQ